MNKLLSLLLLLLLLSLLINRIIIISIIIIMLMIILITKHRNILQAAHAQDMANLPTIIIPTKIA